MSDPGVADGQDDVGLLSASVLANPYPSYRRLRETDPVHWSEEIHGWVLTRFQDVYPALRDPVRFSSRRVAKLVSDRVPAPLLAVVAPFVRLASQWAWMIDPPEHTRLRKLLNHGFTPRAVRQLRTLIEQTVHGLLNRVSERGEMDLIADLAYPLPAIVLADVYGIPRSDAELLKKWSDDMKVFIGGSPDLSAKAHAAAAGLEEMMRYFAAAVAQRRKAPQPDLITALLRAEEGGDFLSEQELCSNLVLVLAASYVTSMDMIGNGVFALLQQHSQWRRLQASRDQVPSAIDEILRYDGPVQLTHRLATEDILLHGRMIAKGDLVYLMRGAANRDPDRFPEPDTVQVDRRDTGHVAFGAGVHYCLGAGLARMEGAAALCALLDRMPDLALAQGAQVRYRADSLQFRGLSALPVTFTPKPCDDRH